MKRINQTAAKTFGKLVEQAKANGGHVKINNSASFMPVVVEILGDVSHIAPGYSGELVSVTHYGEQNGDMMRDPDMEFLFVHGEAYPVSYRNDYVGDVSNPVEFGAMTWVDFHGQAALARFANDWMKNIRLQQGL